MEVRRIDVKFKNTNSCINKLIQSRQPDPSPGPTTCDQDTICSVETLPVGLQGRHTHVDV